MGLLIDKKQKHRCQVLTEKLDDIEASLEHTPWKSLKRLAQETGVPKSTARTAAQLLKLRPYKTPVIHACVAAPWSSCRVHFCSWFLQPVIEGKINTQLAFFSTEAGFHLQGYINTQHNRYWSSQNPHLIQEVPVHPVKVGVWCTVSARRFTGPVLLMQQLTVKDMNMSFFCNSFHS
jgi:hypothetical protein